MWKDLGRRGKSTRVQESTWYVITYELSSTLEDRRKGIGSGENRTLDHLGIWIFGEEGIR